MAERSERSLGLDGTGEISATKADELLSRGQKIAKKREREHTRA